MPHRSDYLEIYETAGCEGLNRAIQARFPHPDAYWRELARMERMGNWQVAWEADAGLPLVIGHRPLPERRL